MRSGWGPSPVATRRPAAYEQVYDVEQRFGFGGERGGQHSKIDGLAVAVHKVKVLLDDVVELLPQRP